jgi:hypothetical protein
VLEVAFRPEGLRGDVVAFVEQRVAGFEHECLVCARYVRAALSEFLNAPLAQLYQVAAKSEQNQRQGLESLHYSEARVGFPGAVMRGGGWDGRLTLSWFTRSFCSALSSVRLKKTSTGDTRLLEAAPVTDLEAFLTSRLRTTVDSVKAERRRRGSSNERAKCCASIRAAPLRAFVDFIKSPA